MINIYQQTTLFILKYRLLAVLLAFFIICPSPAKALAEADYQELKKEAHRLIENLEKIDYHGEVRLKVTLEELLVYYIALHRTTKQARINTQIATEFSKVASGIFSPKINLELSQNRTPLTITAPNSGISNQLSEQKVELSQLTPWGISYYVNAISQKIDSRKVDLDTKAKRYDLGQSDDNYLNSASIGVNIPLLKGFGKSATTEAKKATLEALQSQLSEAITVDQLAQQVVGIYWDVVAVFRYIEALRSKLGLSKKLVQETQIGFELGTTTNSNVLEFKAQVLEDENNLKQAIHGLYKIDDLIKDALGLPDLPYGVYPADSNDVLPFDTAKEAVLAAMTDYSFELKSLQLEREKAIFDKESSGYNRLPRLDLGLGYSVYGYGQTQSEANSLVNQSNINGYRAALTFEMPLGGGNYALNRAHTLKIDLIDEQISLLNSKIVLTVNEYFRQIDLALSQVNTREQTLDLRKTLLDQTLATFKLGSATAFEVGEAQLRYLLSQQSLDQAKADYLKTYYDITINQGKLAELFPRLKKVR